jgi:hypothetical protein
MIMKHEKISEMVEQRLEEWADWILRNNDFGLGYPKQSIEAYLMKYGNVVIQQSNQPGCFTNPRAEEMEMQISLLAKQTRILADALRINYLTIGTLQEKAKKINKSPAQLKIYLSMAKQWLAGRFS